MREFYTAKELIEQKVPGFPCSSDRRLREWLKANCETRQRQGTKAIEAHVKDFPAEAQQFLGYTPQPVLPQCSPTEVKDGTSLHDRGGGPDGAVNLPAPSSQVPFSPVLVQPSADAKGEAQRDMPELLETASPSLIPDVPTSTAPPPSIGSSVTSAALPSSEFVDPFKDLNEPPWYEQNLRRPQRRALLRKLLIDSCDLYIDQPQFKRRKFDAENEFCKLYNDRKFRSPFWLMEEFLTVSRASLVAWRKAHREQGIDGLEDNYKPRPKRIEQGTRLYAYLAKKICKKDQPAGPKALIELLKKDYPYDDIPSDATVRRWYKWFTQTNYQTRRAWMKATDPDRYKNKYQSAIGSYSEHLSEPNQLWELDSTPADIQIVIDGKKHRWSIVGCIDVYSRKGMLLATPTSTGEAIVTLLRRCILEWGKPKTIKTDNGKDYKSERVAHACSGLGIEQKFCNPFSPEQKPHIESMFRTFSHGLLEQMPGYIGHDVAERKRIEARESFADRLTKGKQKRVMDLSEMMTPETFQEYCDTWAGIYNESYHSSIKTRPEDKFREGVKETVEEKYLDILMAKGDHRTVQKKGIKIDNRWYVCEGKHAELIGAEIHYRETGQPGVVNVFSDVSCKEFLGVAYTYELLKDRRELAVREKQKAKEIDQGTLTQVRNEGSQTEKDWNKRKRAKRKSDGQALLEHKIEQNQNIRRLPPVSKPADLPALEAAVQTEAALAEQELRDIRHPFADRLEAEAEEKLAAERAKAKTEAQGGGIVEFAQNLKEETGDSHMRAPYDPSLFPDPGYQGGWVTTTGHLATRMADPADLIAILKGELHSDLDWPKRYALIALAEKGSWMWPDQWTAEISDDAAWWRKSLREALYILENPNSLYVALEELIYDGPHSPEFLAKHDVQIFRDLFFEYLSEIEALTIQSLRTQQEVPMLKVEKTQAA